MPEENNKKVMSAKEFFAQQNGTNNANEVNNNKKNTEQYQTNMSGKGSSYPTPDSVVKRFNWGAFLFTWIWGLGNNTYITLLIFVAGVTCIIPIIGWLICLGMQIWFGIKGNEWAWQNKHFESIDKFHNYQKKWAIAGVICCVAGIILSIIMYATILSFIFNSSAPISKDYTNKIENVDANLSQYEKNYDKEMKKLDDDLAKAQKDYEEQMKKIDAMLKDMEQEQKN